MKHTTIKKLLAISTLAIALPFANLSHAESGKHCEKHGSKSGHHARMGQNNMGQNGMAPHLHALNLTQEQQDKVFAIMHEQAPAKYAQHKQQRETRQALRTLAQADTFNEAKAQQLTDQLAKQEKENAMSRLKTEAKITALLTPEQRQKAREFKPEHNIEHGMGKPARFKHNRAPAPNPTNG